jgi:hypothetical protein
MPSRAAAPRRTFTLTGVPGARCFSAAPGRLTAILPPPDMTAGDVMAGEVVSSAMSSGWYSGQAADALNSTHGEA